MMSRAGTVVVVSGTVVSGTVVSGTVVSGIVVSSVAGAVSGVDDSVTLFDPLEEFGVLLTAQADNMTKPSAINAHEGCKKRTLLRAINKYYANDCYF
jgi:hypothetical protein